MISRHIPYEAFGNSFDVPDLVQLACRYPCKITIGNQNAAFDAKSIMGMMSLNPREGGFKITADGEQEEAAVEALVHLLTRNE